MEGTNDDYKKQSEYKNLTHKFDKMMRALYGQRGAQLDIDILASDEAQSFINAHAGILDSTFKQVRMTDKMRERLTRSNYIFSGIKTFHELNEAFPSLLDENGDRKPFERFLNDVRKIDETYNANYLHAEYNFVQASAEMAAKWEQYSEDGDRYLLQYRTAHDDKVRPEHAALDRITLPMGDPFWESYYPPNGWNCRCTVVQVRRGKYEETPHNEAMSRGEEVLNGEKLSIFRFNSGKQGKTMPDYNPYTIKRCNDCDVAKGKLGLVNEIVDNQLCAACRIVTCLADNRPNKLKENKAIYDKIIKDKSYKDVQYDERSGGVKATHIEHNIDEKKGWYETTVQDVGFKNGHSVILGAEPQNVYKHKWCEGTWDKLPFEIAGAESATANNIRNALKHCASKPETKIAVLFFPNENFTHESFLEGLAKYNGLRKTSQYKKFDLIYCIQKDKIVQIKKPG